MSEKVFNGNDIKTQEKELGKPYRVLPIGILSKEKAAEKIREFGLYHAIQDLPYSALTVCAFEMAIEALEKQTPKKPTHDGVTAISYCPYCNKQLRTYINIEVASTLDGTYIRKPSHPAYCEVCGQAIDWSKE